MTEEEWKAFEAHLESIVDPQPDQTKFYHSVLLAYKELKERREDEEWLHKNHAALGYAKPDTTFAPGRLHLKVGDTYHAFPEGTTLHAAILAARGGK